MGTSFQSSVEKQLSTAFIMTSKFWWVLLMSLVAAKTSALPAPAPQDEYDEEDYEEEEEDVVQEKFAKFNENSDGQLTPDEILTSESTFDHRHENKSCSACPKSQGIKLDNLT